MTENPEENNIKALEIKGVLLYLLKNFDFDVIRSSCGQSFQQSVRVINKISIV